MRSSHFCKKKRELFLLSEQMFGCRLKVKLLGLRRRRKPGGNPLVSGKNAAGQKTRKAMENCHMRYWYADTAQVRSRTRRRIM